MSKNSFYSQIVDIESVTLELDQMDLSDSEKVHLAELIDSSLHHTILDAILSELNEEDKQVFMRYLQENDDEKIWQHLNGKVSNIEEKIKNAAEELKKELHKDIKEARARK